MKTRVFNKLKGAIRIAFLALLAVMTVTGSGCGKKKSNNHGGVPYYGYGANPACTNCANGANALLSSALGAKTSGSVPLRVEIGLELYGQNVGQQVTTYPTSYPTQYPNQYPNQNVGANSDPYAIYQGAVQAQGRMRITQADTYCGVPAGDYTLSTTTAGQYERGMIRGLILQASGSYPLTIRLDNTMVNNSNLASISTIDGRQYPKRLQNDIWINNCRYVIE